MNEKKQIILERKANEAAKAINSAFSVVYAGDCFTLCAYGRVVANCDTMSECTLAAFSYYSEHKVKAYAVRWHDIPEFHFSGRCIQWMNDGYIAHPDKHGQWFITFTSNGSSVGLNQSEYNPTDFYWYELPLNKG